MVKTEEKYQRLKQILKDMEGVLVAFSAGVDSTFVLKVAHDVLGEKVLAVTARSVTYPLAELEEAKQLASSLGVRHLIVESKEINVPGFSNNPPNRCYYCKTELYDILTEIARRENIPYVVDGTNYDDIQDYRPGMKATAEHGVRSPLKEAGLTKEEIRYLSRELGLPTWDKPSFACLSSRFPYGDQITVEKLQRVEAAENFLRQFKFKQLRVRHHDKIARIELTKEDMVRVVTTDIGDKIVAKFKELGYAYVTLDLQGYRTGSMNEVLLKLEMVN
ncbi:MAG TPA: ATP-dependent sacrificial sulfur transferase LarE [Candidatus Limnocylindrales bacterium]|nr:ATP-dependent sacrificial sulfur transferase LarE [Candidatus Limnocylindrales bacterium]